jgi:large subunit ribosomal protein L22
MANTENKEVTETVKPVQKTAKAVAKNIGVSPRKIKLMIDLIRGKKVGEAIAILKNTESMSRTYILKVVTSAAANAEHNFQMDASKLYVKEVYANQGATLKRFRARAKGVGNRILKRSCQITVVLAESEK